MLAKLIGGRSIAGIIAAVIGAVLAIVFLADWNLGATDRTEHWLLGQLLWNPIIERILSLITLIATAFVVRYQVNESSISERKGAHQLLLVALLACTAVGLFSYLQLVAACCNGLAFLMMIDTPPQGKKRDPIFHLGIIHGVAILLDPSLFWLTIMLVLVMVRVGRHAWRNWIALSLGVLFPIVVLYTLALIFNFHTGLAESALDQFRSIAPLSLAWKALAFPAIVLLASMVGLMANFPPLTVTEKVAIQSFGLWLLGATLALAFGLVDQSVILINMTIPASVFIARWMEYVNRKWLVDLAYLGLVVSLLV